MYKAAGTDCPFTVIAQAPGRPSRESGSSTVTSVEATRLLDASFSGDGWTAVSGTLFSGIVRLSGGSGSFKISKTDTPSSSDVSDACSVAAA